MLEYYKDTLCSGIINNLTKRNMEGYYAKNKEEAKEIALSLIKKDELSSWGGSVTLEEVGIIQALRDGYNCLDRDTTRSIQEKNQLYSQVFSCDNFFMSTNAITTEGQLINIDGSGNRIAPLIFGPKKVIIVCGINKVCHSLDEGMSRAKNVAAPINAIRLKRKTPCVKTGKCNNCLTDECICGQTVITRRSSLPNRIKVILVGESLGF